MNVLLCDDEPSIRLLFRTALERFDADVIEAESGLACLQRIFEHAPDVVVLDLLMPGRSGLDVLPDVLLACPRSSVFLVSAHAAPEVFAEARALGATDCFEKLDFLPHIPDVLGLAQHTR